MKTKCVVIGAGGHSRSLCSILLESRGYDPVMVIDLNFSGEEENILGLRVGGVKEDLSEDLQSLGVENLFLAIGDNEQRKALFLKLKGNNFLFPNLIAKTAILKQEVKCGEGNIVFDNAYIGALTKIGDNNIINTGTVIEHECVIGSHCNIGPCTAICGRSRIGDRVFTGASSTVIDKVRVSSSVVLGAGAVVARDLELPGTYIGVPAQRVRNKSATRIEQ